MFKMMILVSIVALSTYVGYSFAEKFNLRLIQLKETQKSLILLQNEVLYNSTPLPEALFSIGTKVKMPLSSTFVKAADVLMKGRCSSVKDAFESVYKEDIDSYHFSKDDINVISDFLRSLGETGIYAQDKIFNVVNKNLELNIKEADIVAKKNTKVYRSLGVCIGSMIAIFFI